MARYVWKEFLYEFFMETELPSADSPQAEIGEDVLDLKPAMNTAIASLSSALEELETLKGPLSHIFQTEGQSMLEHKVDAISKRGLSAIMDEAVPMDNKFKQCESLKIIDDVSTALAEYKEKTSPYLKQEPPPTGPVPS